MTRSIQVVGRGVVGEATGEVLRRLGHDVWYFDIDSEKSDVPVPVDADFHFVCTPENVVEEAVLELGRNSNADPVVVRSTVPVGTVDRLNDKIEGCVLHFPEFLRETDSLMDEWNPSLLVLGTPGDNIVAPEESGKDFGTSLFDTEQCFGRHISELSQIYSPIMDLKITSAKNSELLKLGLNGFFSTVITYWNQLNVIAEATGANSHEVAALARRELRVPTYGTLHGDGFGGRCLPKDLRQLIEVGEDAGVNPSLLKEVEQFNNRIVEKEVAT